MGSIVVKNLGKAYKVYPGRLARLKEWLNPFSKPKHQVKWVLNDLNFEIKPGEAVGIIGINGAGKSTLLKMLTGTTQPTTGSIEIKGRVAALLELGIGFHPEFTGRQNAVMAGQLLGMSKQEVESLMPEIEAFAEIGEYIDMPLRVYSSGMQMRLAFSVATARRPDILIVDEALSVGDDYFQHKCFERIRLFRAAGCTLLIVSHDKQAIQTICDKAILLNKGKLELEGAPKVVMDFYNALLAENQKQVIRQVRNTEGVVQVISGTGEASVTDIKILGDDGCVLDVITTGQSVTLYVSVTLKTDLERLVFGFGIKDRMGIALFGTNTHFTEQQLEMVKVGDVINYRIKFNMILGPGSYSVQTALTKNISHIENNYEWRDLALTFTVINDRHPIFIGNTWIDPLINVEYLASEKK